MFGRRGTGGSSSCCGRWFQQYAHRRPPSKISPPSSTVGHHLHLRAPLSTTTRASELHCRPPIATRALELHCRPPASSSATGPHHRAPSVVSCSGDRRVRRRREVTPETSGGRRTKNHVRQEIVGLDQKKDFTLFAD
jgi:hypothetical protein